MNEQARHLTDRARDLAAATSFRHDSHADGTDTRADDDPSASPGQRRPRTTQTGLILAGGGAKGAYQAGVVEVLGDLGVPVTAIGGASIGALNGAVLACAPELRAGAGALIRMWREVAAIAAGPEPVVPPPSWRESRPVIDQLRLLLENVRSPVLRPDFISGLITRHVDPARLASGPELWVTASASTDLDLVTRQFGWLADLVLAHVERQAEWFCVSRLPDEQIVPALLASAALPLVFGPSLVGTRRYRDGGLKDNLPLAPLVANCGCDLIVVVHLSIEDEVGSRRFRDADILEIRPRRSLDPAGSLGVLNGLLDFSPKRVDDLIAEGRRDAREALELLRASVTSNQMLRQSTRAVLRALSELES